MLTGMNMQMFSRTRNISEEAYRKYKSTPRVSFDVPVPLYLAVGGSSGGAELPPKTRFFIMMNPFSLKMTTRRE